MTSYQLAMLVIIVLQPTVASAMTLPAVLLLVYHPHSVRISSVCQFGRFGNDVLEDFVLLVQDVASSDILEPEDEGTPSLRNV